MALRRGALLAAVLFAACSSPERNGGELVRAGAQAIEDTEHETFGAPTLSLQWDLPDAAETVSASTSIVAHVRNLSSAPIDVEITLTAAGLDQRRRNVGLGTYTLQSGAVQALYVPLGTLPVQSIHAPSQVVLRAAQLGTGALSRAFTSPMSYEFSSDYASVVLRGRSSSPFNTRATTLENLYSPTSPWGVALSATTGRATDATGTLVDVATLPPTPGGGGGIGPSIEIFADNVLWDDPSPGPVDWSQGTTNTYRICTSWRGDFVDSGYGEDAMVAQGAADYPASYTQYTLTDSNGAVLVDEFGALVDGVLYADGCSAIVSLTPGATYHLAQRTILQKGVQLLLTKNLNTVVIMTSIVPSAVAATTNIYVKPSQLDDFTRVSAVVAGALRAHDMTSMSGTTWLYPSDQCPGGGSCVIQGEAYYGQNQYGQSDTYSKVIVAHELGHVYQDLLTGLPATAGVVDSVAPLCRCDHVTDPSASSHCLQSRHSGSLPMVEGFAHFFAAKTFNWQSESNCTFPYYKEFVTADNIVHSPPYAIDCDAQTQWMQSYCVQSGDGVEMDWMQFFWSLTRPAAGATTIPDLDDIYFRACNNAECDGSKEVDYEDVRTAAQGHFQGSLQKYDYFVAKADQHGVDH